MKLQREKSDNPVNLKRVKDLLYSDMKAMVGGEGELEKCTCSCTCTDLNVAQEPAAESRKSAYAG